MKYLLTTVLASSTVPNEKGLYRADVLLKIHKKLADGTMKEIEEVLTVSSRISLKTGEAILEVESEFDINNKKYIKIKATHQKLEIQKK